MKSPLHKWPPKGTPGAGQLGAAPAGVLLGAAFLMANSSIGPGFLTQTSVFTGQLLASFGFVILVSVLLDIGAQLNTWRVLTASGYRAQDLANRLLPGLGYGLCILVVIGGFAFNIGNIAGSGLGLNVLFGVTFREGAILSAGFALLLFWSREIGRMLDRFTIILGALKIGLTCFIAWAAHPPIFQAAHHTFAPDHLSATAIVTIVGGTVGGYITFSGAHRLLDAGVGGQAGLKQATRSAISGVAISTLMRFVLFLAVLGAVTHGVVLNRDNPASSVFRFASGEWGYRVFGLVLWSAAISAVVGASYTSVSFFKTFHPALLKHERLCISAFIICSALVFIWIGKPTPLLIFAGWINGLILPLALSVLLIASLKPRLMNGYHHPVWMQVCGWVVVAIMSGLAFKAMITPAQAGTPPQNPTHRLQRTQEKVPDPPALFRLPDTSRAARTVQKPRGTHTLTYDGYVARTDPYTAAVVNVSVGNEDLRQCADAVMRLRGEYLYHQKDYKDIAFHFESGFRCDYKHYAGTLSLEKELEPVTNPSTINAGDIFIHGGSPGHCFIVIEVVENSHGEKQFLLAQGFMPAQNIQVLKAYDSPWFSTAHPAYIPYGELVTPPYLRRFP